MELPSDTDTTSCFESDGTSMMRSCDLQSSDSGAALLHHPTAGIGGGSTGGRKKRRQQGLPQAASGGVGGNGDPSGEWGGGGGSRASKRLSKKAKRLIRRHHEEFFLMHDTKYWAAARQICFWGSIVAILGAIAAAAAMIAVMPRACDPATAWWQGSVILEIGPTVATVAGGPSPRLDREFWIERLPILAGLGIRGLKLVDIYLMETSALSAVSPNGSSSSRAEYHNPGSRGVVEERAGSAAQLRQLAEAVHAANLSLLVEIPTFSSLVVMSLDLR
jgi:hypothetical protein